MDNNGILDILGRLKAMEARIKEAREYAEALAKPALMEAYNSSGTTQQAIKVNGERVGTLYVAENKPRIEVTDAITHAKWLKDAGYIQTREAINAEALPIERIKELWPEAIYEEEFMPERPELVHVGSNVLDAKTGDIAEGVEFFPASAKYVAVKGCKPEDVLPLCAPSQLLELMSEPYALLGGGHDGD